MKRNLMRRAHEIARTMEGDYRARMSLALRQAWEEEKGMKEVKLYGSEKQVKWAKDIRGNLQLAKEIFDGTTFDEEQTTADPSSRRFDKELDCMVWDRVEKWTYRSKVEEGYKNVMVETEASNLINTFGRMKKDNLEEARKRINEDSSYEKEFVISFYNQLLNGEYIA